MTRVMRNLSRGILVGSAFVAGMAWSGVFRPAAPGDLVTQAQAIIGRPLTPVSYAGVARRTTVRAAAYAPVAYGAAAATAATAGAVAAQNAAAANAAAAAAAVPAGCVRVTDSSGASYTRCP